MKRIFVAVMSWVVLLAMVASGDLHAEGRCPPGQYPVASNGCAPIPGYGGAQTQQRPQVIQRTIYIDSYGAIAMHAKTGSYSVAVDKSTRREAVDAAMDKCNAYVGGGCLELVWFRNGCEGLVWAGGKVYTATSETKDDAVAKTMSQCEKSGAQDCELMDVVCSIPMMPPG